ncbi:MAG TPA: hypothetical protein PLV92_16940, partial [Pirellulaceae bacterium]|nr:hypothetical protein [Pirellulaceae bacterium]
MSQLFVDHVAGVAPNVGVNENALLQLDDSGRVRVRVAADVAIDALVDSLSTSIRNAGGRILATDADRRLLDADVDIAALPSLV